MKKKLIIGLILVLSVGTIFTYNLVRLNHSIPVTLIKASTGKIAEKIYANGVLESSRVTKLISEVSGKAAEVKAKVGDQAVKGQVLLVLDTADIERQLEVERNNLKLIQVEREQARKQHFETVKQEITSGQNKSNDTLDLTSYDLRIANEKITIADLEKKLANNEVVADQQGVITAINVEQGQSIQNGIALFEITDTQHLRVKAYLNQLDANKVKLAMPAVVTGDAFADAFDGSVSYLSPVAAPADPTSKDPSVEVRIDILHVKPELRPGFNATVAIELQAVPHVLVPLTAVQREGEHDYIYRIKDGKAARVEVKLGQEDDTHAEVLSGLKDGEEIIADVTKQISEGKKVKPK